MYEIFEGTWSDALIIIIIFIIIIIIIIKKDWQCKAGRGRLTPYQSEDPLELLCIFGCVSCVTVWCSLTLAVCRVWRCDARYLRLCVVCDGVMLVIFGWVSCVTVWCSLSLAVCHIWRCDARYLWLSVVCDGVMLVIFSCVAWLTVWWSKHYHFVSRCVYAQYISQPWVYLCIISSASRVILLFWLSRPCGWYVLL